MDLQTEQQWEGEILFLPEPTGRSQMIAKVRAYWQERNADNRLPRRAHIDPLDLRDVLPYLSIMEVGDPFRLKFRLVGTELARFYGLDVTGKWIDEIPQWAPEDIVDTVRVFRRVVERGVPAFGLSTCLWQENPDHMFEFACFPLSDDGVSITHIFSIDDYTMVAPKLARGL